MIRERLSVQELWIAKKMNLWRPKQQSFRDQFVEAVPKIPDARFVRYRINALRRRKNYQAVKNVDAKMRGGCSLREMMMFLGQECADAERRNDVGWEDITAKKWKYVELINFVQVEYEASNTAEDELAKKLFFEEV